MIIFVNLLTERMRFRPIGSVRTALEQGRSCRACVVANVTAGDEFYARHVMGRGGVSFLSHVLCAKEKKKRIVWCVMVKVKGGRPPLADIVTGRGG